MKDISVEAKVDHDPISGEEAIERLAAVVSSSEDAIISKDLNGVITNWNKGAEKIFGYSKTEAIGRKIDFLLPPGKTKEEYRYLNQVLKGNDFSHHEAELIRKDGKRIIVSTNASPIIDANGRVVGVSRVSQDITHQKQAAINLIKAKGDKAERAAELVIAEKEKLKRSAELVIAIQEKAKRVHELIIANKELLYENEEKAKRAAELVIANKELLYQNEEKAKRAAELVIANEEKAKRVDELVVANEELAIQNKEKAKMADELLVANEEKAIRVEELMLANKQLALESDEKAKRAAELITANTNKLELELVNRDKLHQSLMETIGIARELVELRDPYTAGHERRVGGLAQAIASAMGLSEVQQEGLLIAGYLHDIGKITIPAEILSKPGKINAEEYALIKGHVLAGYNLLKSVDFPWDISQAVLEHHERLDGSGYPNALSADQISVEGRILAVSDVVEAMSSYRPYRPALGIEVALAEIERGKGTIYDAKVVDACLQLFNEKRYSFASAKSKES
jgi:PAS domain S-box-containing protein/putative nucleotidyltransferase with HDIG domain